MSLCLTCEVENQAYACSAKERMKVLLDLLAGGTLAHQRICIDSNNSSPSRV